MPVAAGRAPASRPALVRAAAASTMPNPTWLSYPSAGRSVVVEVSALATRSGASRGYFALIRAATPATSAQAGLVPLTSQYPPSRPCAGTFTPGAATWTDRLSLENLATAPVSLTAPTLSTPGYSAGKDTGAKRPAFWASFCPELPEEATSTTP